MRTKHLFKAAALAGLLACGGGALADSGDTKASEPESKGIRNAINDTAITAKVKSKFSNDSRLNHTEIDVDTANGVVYLKGSAPSLKAKAAATELAKNVDGVLRVENDLVTPEAEISSVESKVDRAAEETERVASDSWITTKVKAALLADQRTKGSQISVKTTNKVVHLTGEVDSKAEVNAAEEIARGIKHVKEVDTSNLKTGKG